MVNRLEEMRRKRRDEQEAERKRIESAWFADQEAKRQEIEGRWLSERREALDDLDDFDRKARPERYDHLFHPNNDRRSHEEVRREALNSLDFLDQSSKGFKGSEGKNPFAGQDLGALVDDRPNTEIDYENLADVEFEDPDENWGAAAIAPLSSEAAPAKKEVRPLTREEIYASMIPFMAERERREAEEVAAERKRNEPPIIDIQKIEPLTPEELHANARRDAIRLKQRGLEARMQEIAALQANITDFEQRVEEQMQGIEKKYGINPVHHDEGSIPLGKKLWSLMQNAVHVLKGTSNESPAAALEQNRINRRYLIEQQGKLAELIQEKEQLERELKDLTQTENDRAAEYAQRKRSAERAREEEQRARTEVKRHNLVRPRRHRDWLDPLSMDDSRMAKGAEERARDAFTKIGMGADEAARYAREIGADAEWQKKRQVWERDTKRGNDIDLADWDGVLRLDQQSLASSSDERAQDRLLPDEERADGARFGLGDSNASGNEFAAKRKSSTQEPSRSNTAGMDELDKAA